MDVSDLTSPVSFDCWHGWDSYVDSYSAQVSESCNNFQTLRNGKLYPIQGIPAYKVTINSVDSQSTVTRLDFLPVETNVKPFTGQDEDYSVRTFLSMCENVMWQSGTTDDVHKIAFVRSRLAPGSRALKIMPLKSPEILDRTMNSLGKKCCKF